MQLWGNGITTSLGRWLTWTLWMKFTWCPNLMFLLSPWLEIYKFSNWLFCWLWVVQSWWSFCLLWANQNWPYSFILVPLGRSQLFYWVWAKHWEAKNNPNFLCLTKSSGTMHKVWHKSFSMIQSTGIKNWVPQ